MAPSLHRPSPKDTRAPRTLSVTVIGAPGHPICNSQCYPTTPACDRHGAQGHPPVTGTPHLHQSWCLLHPALSELPPSPLPRAQAPLALCSLLSSHLCAHFSVSSPGFSPSKSISATRADPGLRGSLLPPSTPGRRLPIAPPSGHPAPKSPFSTFPVVLSSPSPASPSLPAGPSRLSLSVFLPGPLPTPTLSSSAGALLRVHDRSFMGFFGHHLIAGWCAP